MSSFKSSDHRKIVKSRWKARIHWRAIEMPDTMQIRNNKEGKREIREVCLKKTKHIINELYYAIFVKNWKAVSHLSFGSSTRCG